MSRSIAFLFLADRSGQRGLLLLVVPLCSSVYLGCNEWPFELVFNFTLLKPIWLFSSDLNKACVLATTMPQSAFFQTLMLSLSFSSLS